MKSLSLSVFAALLVLATGGLSAQILGGWDSRDDVPHNVYSQDCADLVFVRRPESTFVFAYNANNTNSWLNAYRPQDSSWSGDLAAPPFSIWCFAMAHAPEARRLYAVGNFLHMGMRLYTYTFDSPSGSGGTWSSESLPFNVHGGSKMAYRPNRNYAPLHAIPGWLYVTGITADTPHTYELYRYSIPAPEDLTEDGYCPAESAVTADATPNFIWPSVSGAAEYRVKVGTTPSFTVTEIDELSHDTTFQVPESLCLANGPQYWTTSSRDSHGAWTNGPVLHFTLEHGWDDGVPIPWESMPQSNSCLVYTCRVGGLGSAMAESLWATQGMINDSFWHCYSIHSGTWTLGPKMPRDGFKAMMASAPNPTTHDCGQIYAVFDSVQGAHYRFDLSQSPARWVPIPEAPFPREPGYMCRLAYDPELEILYATVGSDTALFYARCAASGSGDMGGRSSGIQARVGDCAGQRLVAGKSGDGFFIQYTMPVAEPARLDVYDPTGRKVLGRDLGVVASGRHSLRVSASEFGARKLATHRGVLLIRLAHGSTIEHAKVVLF